MDNKIIIIKPHHFLDIIKLHGAGLNVFVPDKKMGHDFYKIGNIILNNKNILIKLTIENDDICSPCKYCHNGKCIDNLTGIKGYTQKDTYNKTLDKRMIELYNLDLNKEYTAYELCNIYLSNPEFIYKVWQEEDDEKTDKRYELFKEGAKKYTLKKEINK
ncbi:MAG: DUF1284 domain-containing protein [Bacilli bacterium]|nr:DUF1284 domain-containing protein [Bacilli bacterium]